MSTFTDPLTSFVTPPFRSNPVPFWSRNAPVDPQLEVLLDQSGREKRGFDRAVLGKRAAQAAYPIWAPQPPRNMVEAGRIQARPHESPEMRWLVGNAKALERYRGEWLLIQGNDLVAHSNDFNLIRETITDRNIRAPFVYYVPTEEESNFIAI